MSFHLVFRVGQLTGLCFGSPSRRSNGSLGHPSIQLHKPDKVLMSFTMTAIVANAADIRRSFNLGRTVESTSDTTIRRIPKTPRKCAHHDARNTTTTSLYPAKVPEPSSIASIASRKTDARRDARPTGTHVGIFATEDFMIHHPTNASTSLDGARQACCRHFHYPFATISITPL